MIGDGVDAADFGRFGTFSYFGAGSGFFAALAGFSALAGFFADAAAALAGLLAGSDYFFSAAGLAWVVDLVRLVVAIRATSLLARGTAIGPVGRSGAVIERSPGYPRRPKRSVQRAALEQSPNIPRRFEARGK